MYIIISCLFINSGRLITTTCTLHIIMLLFYYCTCHIFVCSVVQFLISAESSRGSRADTVNR